MLGLRNEVGMKSNCWFETYIAVGVVRLVGRYSILEEVIRDNIFPNSFRVGIVFVVSIFFRKYSGHSQ